MSAVLSTLLERLRQDNTSGATELALAAVELLTVFVESPAPLPSFQQALVRLVSDMLAAQPSMAILITLGQHVFQACPPELDPALARQALRHSLASFRSHIQHSTASLCEQALDVIPAQASVLTYSNSGTVTAALQYAFMHGRLKRVLLSESRPAYDGRLQALELLRHGIPVEFSIDMALFERLSEADVVLVGADAVTSQGVCNKLGTHPLALLAQQQHVPMFSLCTTGKFLPATALPFLHIADHPSQEVWAEAPVSLRVTNRYFDTTPLACLRGVVSEEGLHTAEALHQRLGTLPFSPIFQELLSQRSSSDH